MYQFTEDELYDIVMTLSLQDVVNILNNDSWLKPYVIEYWFDGKDWEDYSNLSIQAIEERLNSVGE